MIRAVHEIARRRDDVRLYFLGVKHPNPEIPDMAMAGEAVALAEELGLRDRVVFFNFGWVPYAERGRYLLEADVAVSAHFDDIETRFAFRTRLLDCLWAGLPIVTTRGDTLGELIVADGAGQAVDVGDVDGWVRRLRLCSTTRPRSGGRGVRPPRSGPHSSGRASSRRSDALPSRAAPLRRRPASDTRAAGIEYFWLRLRIGVARTTGFAGTARRMARQASAAARRRLRRRAGARVP